MLHPLQKGCGVELFLLRPDYQDMDVGRIQSREDSGADAHCTTRVHDCLSMFARW